MDEAKNSTTLTEELPELVELPEEDSRAAYARNTAMMSVGTTLSRIDRVPAHRGADGRPRGACGLARRHLHRGQHHPEHHLRARPGRDPHVRLRPGAHRAAAKRGRGAPCETAHRFLTITLVLLTAVTVVGAMIAPWIMRLYLGGVDDPIRRAQEIELGTFFLRWFMPQIVFYGVGAVAGGLLTANRRFAAPMFAPVLNNLAVIVTMFALIAMPRGRRPHGSTDAHVRREDVAGRGHDVRCPGHDRGTVAGAPR